MLTMFLQMLDMLQLHVFEVESFLCSVVTALCLWLWFLVRFRHKKHSVGVKKTSFQAVMTSQYHTAQSDTTVNILIATFTMKSDTLCLTCYPHVVSHTAHCMKWIHFIPGWFLNAPTL